MLCEIFVDGIIVGFCEKRHLLALRVSWREKFRDILPSSGKGGGDLHWRERNGDQPTSTWEFEVVGPSLP